MKMNEVTNCKGVLVHVHIYTHRNKEPLMDNSTVFK